VTARRRQVGLHRRGTHALQRADARHTKMPREVRGLIETATTKS
jgi:hypothetical protein